MNAYTLLTFVVALSSASGGVIGPSAAVLQGPSRKTTVVGPDGSAISAIAPGGQVFTEEHPGVVAHAAPAPQIIAAVIVDPVEAVVPAVAAHHVTPLVHAVPVVHGVAEGQYVHDHSEALHDDGSYKPHLY